MAEPTLPPARSFRGAVGAALVAVLGAAVCLANDGYWQTKTQSIGIGTGGHAVLGSVGGDLMLAALPFYVLGGFVLATQIRRLAVAFAFCGLTALTIWEYRWNDTTDSSTAALAFLIAPFVGIPLVAAVAVVDGFARGLQRGWRGGGTP